MDGKIEVKCDGGVETRRASERERTEEEMGRRCEDEGECG